MKNVGSREPRFDACPWHWQMQLNPLPSRARIWMMWSAQRKNTLEKQSHALTHVLLHNVLARGMLPAPSSFIAAIKLEAEASSADRFKQPASLTPFDWKHYGTDRYWQRLTAESAAKGPGPSSTPLEDDSASSEE
eukprot:4183411-Karenia_brevis.AAC.1